MSPNSTDASPWRRAALRAILLAAMLPMAASCTSPGPLEPALSSVEIESRQQAYASEPFPVRTVDRRKFDPRLRPSVVAAPTGYLAGTIVVNTQEKLLYLIGNDGTAHRYGIAVGAAGHAWSGNAMIGRKAKWPAWYPTDEMHSQAPKLPRRIEPGPQNPLGARALYLYKDGVDTLYRIHGTSEPWTIGTEASSGCIRMINEDVIDLYEEVEPGAKVVVL